jgi:hypothetical protein
VDPTFSHGAELLYGSGLRPIFLEQLERGLETRLEEAGLFDLAYVRSLVARYRTGDEVRGSEMSDTLSLALAQVFHARNGRQDG